MNDPPNHQGTPAANTASPARGPPAVPLRCTVPDPAPWARPPGKHRGSTGEGCEGTQKSRKKWGEWWIWDEFDELIRYGKYGKDGKFDENWWPQDGWWRRQFYSQKCRPNRDLMDLRWGLEDYFCPLSKKGAVLVMAKWMFTVKTWLVVYLPLWKIWLHQLGWWHSQYMAK